MGIAPTQSCLDAAQGDYDAASTLMELCQDVADGHLEPGRYEAGTEATPLLVVIYERGSFDVAS